MGRVRGASWGGRVWAVSITWVFTGKTLRSRGAGWGAVAGLWWVDWIYMLSMLLIGVALMLGVFTRLAALGGIVWMALFYPSSALWPENNPVIADHVIYALALAGIAAVGAGRFLGLGRWWERKGLAARHPMLR